MSLYNIKKNIRRFFNMDTLPSAYMAFFVDDDAEIKKPKNNLARKIIPGFKQAADKRAAARLQAEALAKKEADLKALKEWIVETTESIKKFIAQNKENPVSVFVGYEFSNATGIELEGMTRKDLKTLQPALYNLHQTCKEANISIEMDGFDLLPRTAAVGKSSYDRDLQRLSIAVRFDEKYNYLINPYSPEPKLQSFEQALN